MRDKKANVKQKTVHWWAWQPTPYNDVLFGSLAKQESLSLQVHYRASAVGSHPWRSSLGNGYVNRCYQPVAGVDWTSVKLPFTDKDALFVVAGWDHLTTIVLLSALRLLRRRFVVWTDTPDTFKKRPAVKEWIRGHWLAWVFRAATRVFATGRPGVDGVQKMGAPASSVVSFPFWLDLDLFAPRPCKRDSIEVTFISSGRLSNRIKGHDIALKALAHAMTSRSIPWKYVIAGHGSDLDSLRHLAETLAMKDRVVFAGWTEPAQLIELYQNSDVLIHPSPVHDPYPNAVLEAMATGLVVLGSDVSGSALDRIEPGVNGLIHRAGDWKSLAAQICQVVEDPLMREEMGRRARITAEAWPLERGIALVRDVAWL